MRQGMRKSDRVSRLNKFTNQSNDHLVIRDGDDSSSSSHLFDDFVFERRSKLSHDAPVSKPEVVQGAKGKSKGAKRKVSDVVVCEKEDLDAKKGSKGVKRKAKEDQRVKKEKENGVAAPKGKKKGFPGRMIQ